MRYNRIDQRFWTDRAVRGWTDDAKLLALYLLTSPHRATEGLFRLPKAYIQADLEWSAERLGQPFRQLLESRFLDYDDDAQVVLIRNALKYQPLQNDNQVTAALKALEELPPTRLAWDFRQLAEQFCQRLAKRLPQGFGEPPAPSPAPSPAPEGSSPRERGSGGEPTPSVGPQAADTTPTADVIDLAETAVERDAHRLCMLLADRIQSWSGERPKIGKRWEDAARLLVTRDGYATEQIVALIEFATESDFWRANILSMPKLREK